VIILFCYGFDIANVLLLVFGRFVIASSSLHPEQKIVCSLLKRKVDIVVTLQL
jgi:hypothetical protein